MVQSETIAVLLVLNECKELLEKSSRHIANMCRMLYIMTDGYSIQKSAAEEDLSKL